jgi:hypothetical protein
MRGIAYTNGVQDKTEDFSGELLHRKIHREIERSADQNVIVFV